VTDSADDGPLFAPEGARFVTRSLREPDLWRNILQCNIVSGNSAPPRTCRAGMRLGIDSTLFRVHDHQIGGAHHSLTHGSWAQPGCGGIEVNERLPSAAATNPRSCNMRPKGTNRGFLRQQSSCSVQLQDPLYRITILPEEDLRTRGWRRPSERRSTCFARSNGCG
jgi:hypothetical protein